MMIANKPFSFGALHRQLGAAAAPSRRPTRPSSSPPPDARALIS
jgi:hypothetical protein